MCSVAELRQQHEPGDPAEALYVAPSITRQHTNARSASAKHCHSNQPVSIANTEDAAIGRIALRAAGEAMTAMPQGPAAGNPEPARRPVTSQAFAPVARAPGRG